MKFEVLLEHLNQGSIKDIAKKLFLSPYTVNAHHGNIMKKGKKRRYLK